MRNAQRRVHGAAWILLAPLLLAAIYLAGSNTYESRERVEQPQQPSTIGALP